MDILVSKRKKPMKLTEKTWSSKWTNLLEVKNKKKLKKKLFSVESGSPRTKSEVCTPPG